MLERLAYLLEYLTPWADFSKDAAETWVILWIIANSVCFISYFLGTKHLGHSEMTDGQRERWWNSICSSGSRCFLYLASGIGIPLVFTNLGLFLIIQIDSIESWVEPHFLTATLCLVFCIVSLSTHLNYTIGIIAKRHVGAANKEITLDSWYSAYKAALQKPLLE